MREDNEQEGIEIRRDNSLINNEGAGRGEEQRKMERTAADICPSKPTWGLVTKAHRGRTYKQSVRLHNQL